MTALLKLDSVMYRVRDLAAATAFYVDRFGVTKVWEDGERRMVGLQLRDSDSEIVLHADPDLPPFDYSFLVDDVREFCAAFERAGGDVRTHPLRVRTGWYAVVRDPDGNAIPIIDLSEFGGAPRYD